MLNDLFDYKNLKIYQNKNGFKFSLDSILLAEFVSTSSKTKYVLDLCTGNAVIPLILSTKTKAHIDSFEIQKEIFDLGKKSIDYNGLNNQITIYNESIRDIDNYLKNRKYDIITCNPPYFKLEEKSNINLNESEAIARHEIEIKLEEIFKIGSRYLNDGGRLYLVHRVDRLDEIIIFANKYNLNVKNVELIKTKKQGKPYLVLVRCIKNSKLGLKINDIKCVENLQTYQNLFKEDI